MEHANFYDYFEERSISNVRSIRSRKTSSVFDPVGFSFEPMNFESSFFMIWYYQILEGPQRIREADHPEAAWAITAKRLARYIGDPGRRRIPESTQEIRHLLDLGREPPRPEDLGPRFRTHHYHRALSASELMQTCRAGVASLSIELTEEWYEPENGIISPISNGSPVLGTHNVSIQDWHTANKYSGLHFPNTEQMFVFRNSWGEWGNYGWGAISVEDVDRFMVEGVSFGPMNHYPPVRAKSGSVILLWKCSKWGKEVHGREIVDAASGERLAWCFLVRRDGRLDIDELFVWPTHRRKGYGTLLAALALELSSEMGLELRALVGFSDAYPVDRIVLEKILARLGLKLHPSPIRSLAFVGLPQNNEEALAEPRFPAKPAAPRYKLDPSTATRLYKVWFATNRRLTDENDLSQGFTGERDDVVRYGECKVAIPKSHRFGSIGSSWYKRFLRRADDRLELVEVGQLEPTAFWRNLSQRLLTWDQGERQALVFLHGYNNSFKDAAIRCAQIGYDLRFSGEVAFFSWPSRAQPILGYASDESAIEASEPAIAQFLIDFATRAGIESLHVIAHSMGNRGLIRAMQRITSVAQEHGVAFGQIILAAPDVDQETFRDLSRNYVELSQRTTLYLSPRDRAVELSSVLHRFPRVGLSPPVTVVDGIDTIEVPNFNVFDVLGHGYFAEAEALLHDMFDLLRHNQPPERRQRVVEAQTDDGKRYWVMEA